MYFHFMNNDVLLYLFPTVVLVLNRLSEVPSFCQQLVLMQSGGIQWQFQVDDDLAEQLTHISQLQHMQQQGLVLPAKDSDSFALHPLDADAPLVKLSNVKVNYADNIVLTIYIGPFNLSNTGK